MDANTVGTLVGFAVAIACTGICFAKGRPALGALGILIGVFSIVGAIRLAKPGSWWYENQYGHAKRRRSWERHEQTAYQSI